MDVQIIQKSLQQQKYASVFIVDTQCQNFAISKNTDIDWILVFNF